MSTPPGVPEQQWWKNLLQQYTQKASMPLPVYQTSSEGTPHAPTFRAQVQVDGTCFTSPNSFLNRKMAEQDAAKYALIGIREKVKSEGSSLILQYTVFCKSIINEYALKMNLKVPTYVTSQTLVVIPVFVSSLILNGVTYIGDAAKNKKEAEQFAARSAVLSILDSESGTTMSEIVKSKFKFYDALKKVKESIPGNITATGINSREDIDSSNVQGSDVPAGVNPLEDSSAPSSVNKRKESCVELPQSTLEQPLNSQATELQPLHESKKPKCQTSSVAIDPPIVPVPPASEQALICSASGKKRKRKNKAKKKVEHESLLPIAMIPQSPVPGCSVAQ